MTAPGTSAAEGPADRTVLEPEVGTAQERRDTPPPVPSSRRQIQWVPLIIGALAVFYGLLVMSLRPGALASIAIFAGVAFIVGGVAQLGMAHNHEGGWRWLAYAGGLIGIAAGVIAFVWPGVTLVVLAVIAAWMFVVNGVVRIVNSLAHRNRELWWLGLIAGIIELLLGMWAVGSPLREVLLLVNLIGIFLVVAGIDAVVTALSRPTPQPGPTAPAAAA